MSLRLDSASDLATTLKCELAAEVLRTTGHLRLQVTGWSMLPSVWPGDTLLIGHAGCDEVSAGDIVLFERDRRLFAHRAVKKLNHGNTMQLVTQGDGMRVPDPVVNEAQLLGKVSSIIRNGRMIEPRRQPSFYNRAVSSLVRRSTTAARAFVSARTLYVNSRLPSTGVIRSCQS